MKVLENDRLIIEFIEKRSYFKVTRIGSDEIEENEYKKLILNWAKEIEFYKPQYQLINYLNHFKPVPSHLQIWINENLIGPSIKGGMKKVAFIISRDYYVQLSVEQTMQEKEGRKMPIKYFDNEADAENWLFDNK